MSVSSDFFMLIKTENLSNDLMYKKVSAPFGFSRCINYTAKNNGYNCHTYK